MLLWPAILIFGAALTTFMLNANELYPAYTNESANAGWQSAAEQQRIREQRLLEWYAKHEHQQAAPASPAEQPVVNNQAPVAAPEAEDLFAAAISGNNNQIARLLSQGLDINVSNAERETALHMAAARGHYPTVIFLVKNGAWINAKTVGNWIPLHHAVRFRHHNIVNFLLNRGSAEDTRTSDGLRAVDMARNINDSRMLAILGAR